MKTKVFVILAFGAALAAQGQEFELLPYGNLNQWITREIKESGILGGATKDVYEIGPTQTIMGDKPYVPLGGSPWATSNVMAKPVGITKTSNSVFPAEHPGNGLCAELTSQIEHCKAAALININVMVTGSIFLGQMIEPIKSTSNPYSHMIMGVPFTKRPKALQFDYKMVTPPDPELVYSSGFGKQKRSAGADQAEVFILLQRRWEDASGNVFAKRVGTGRERFSGSTSGWVMGHAVPVLYGDITADPRYRDYMGLIPEDHCYYTRNSKGKMVPIHEVGWDSPDATPTHIMVMVSSGCGNAYWGTPGLTVWVDNIGLTY